MNYPTPSQPRQVRLDTTTSCQARCLSCHRFLTERKGQMPFELAEKIVLDIARWKQPLTELIPVNYGEALLYPHWRELFCLCDEALPHTQIVLPTNGVLMTDDNIKFLAGIKTLRLVNFSVNAFFPETYKAFMGLEPTNLQRIEAAIKRIRYARPDITLWVSMVHDPAYQTDNERDVFRAYWSQLAQVQIINAASCNRPDKKVEIVNCQPCRSLFSDLVIGYDRKLSSCCFDPGMTLPLSSYSGDVLADWHNPSLEQLRSLHNQGRRMEVALCRGCTFA